MKGRKDYLDKERVCTKAINDFKNVSFVHEWLNSNKGLFDSINYGPDDLPKITSFNFEGESYENIREFSKLYSTISSLF